MIDFDRGYFDPFEGDRLIWFEGFDIEETRNRELGKFDEIGPDSIVENIVL